MPGESELNQLATGEKGKHIHNCGFLCLKMLSTVIPQAPTLTFFKNKLSERPTELDQTSALRLNSKKGWSVNV